jgi:hypothetical protein
MDHVGSLLPSPTRRRTFVPTILRSRALREVTSDRVYSETMLPTSSPMPTTIRRMPTTTINRPAV